MYNVYITVLHGDKFVSTHCVVNCFDDLGIIIRSIKDPIVNVVFRKKGGC